MGQPGGLYICHALGTKSHCTKDVPESMPATPDSARLRAASPDAPEPLRRSRTPVPSPASPIWRKGLNYLLIFATVVLVVDALVGERGLVASTRARRTAAEQQHRVHRLRAENADLRERTRRLKADPTTIEHMAREQLGLIRPGEVLVYIKDLKKK
jgi:cell division protein FtsB